MRHDIYSRLCEWRCDTKVVCKWVSYFVEHIDRANKMLCETLEINNI